MATNRMFLRCKTCGEGFFIGKMFSGDEYFTNEHYYKDGMVKSLNNFFVKHEYCSNDFHSDNNYLEPYFEPQKEYQFENNYEIAYEHWRGDKIYQKQKNLYRKLVNLTEENRKLRLELQKANSILNVLPLNTLRKADEIIEKNKKGKE